MTATATDFLITATLEAFENDRPVFTKAWDVKIPRDGT